MAQTRTPLCWQACITQLCPAARCWDMRCVGEPRRKGRPCLGSSCTGRSCQELRVLPSAGTSFLLSLPPDFFLTPRIIGTGLGPAACLPPLHTKLFSVLSPSPALGREGGRGRSDSQSQLSGPPPASPTACGPSPPGSCPGAGGERPFAPSGPQLSTCECGQITTETKAASPALEHSLLCMHRTRLCS